MQTNQVLKGVKIEKIIGEMPDTVNDISDHSKRVIQGGLFILFSDDLNEMQKHLKEAEQNGCKLVVSEREVKTDACLLIVKSCKTARQIISKNFFCCPEEDLRIIGLVGTNGKTSTCHILSKILTVGGYNVGVTGTLGTYYGGKSYESNLTTPGIIELYRMMRDMVDKGVEILIMELSAHAISQGRVGNVFFDFLIFTNCTEDHLDYFENFKAYAEVKKSVFLKQRSKYMLINSDDAVGIEIINCAKGKKITYGIENPADVFAINVTEAREGISFVINLYDLIFEVESRLIGLCNVYNTLAAAACAGILGVTCGEICKALKEIVPIEGRAEPICKFNGITVFLDYAHTPDGLYRTLTSIKKLCDGKLICVFGCGGNREKEKRPKMGAIAGEIADFSVVTTDNPRFEDQNAILNEIERGIIKKTKQYIIIRDREIAIKYALEKADSGDVVAVCGRGGERYQEIMGEKKAFSDKQVILEAISKLKE